MAAALTGTPTAVTWAAGINPAAQNISIPADATAVYMFWSYYVGSSAGLASATLASASPSQQTELQNSNRSCGVCAWYSPATGTQSLDVAWDAAPSEGATCVVAFVKDGAIDTWRDADVDNDQSTTAVTVTLTTVAGDLVIKFDSRYISIPSLTSGWTNGQTQSNNSQGSRLSYISAASTTQACASEDEDWSSVVAISIGPAAAAAQSLVIPTKHVIQSILAR